MQLSPEKFENIPAKGPSLRIVPILSLANTLNQLWLELRRELLVAVPLESFVATNHTQSHALPDSPSAAHQLRSRN